MTLEEEDGGFLQVLESGVVGRAPAETRSL